MTETAETAGAADTAAPAAIDPTAPVASDGGTPPASTAPDPLATIRAKLAALTGGSAGRGAVQPISSNARDGFRDLPFSRVETPQGPLFQRIESLGPDAQVGLMRLGLAAEADAELLALLSLDPSLAVCEPSRALFFDTETTGLGGAGTLAFLVGMCHRNDAGDWVLEQLMLRHPSEETALLGRVAELVEKASMLVSFNGRSFDWPLLQGRRVMSRISKMEARPHLDLLHVARRIHKRRLSRCRLVDLEAEVLGFFRGKDDIPGAEIAPRYGHFLRTSDEEELRPVVDHNAWDVMTMVALVGLYGRLTCSDHIEDLASTGEALFRAKDYARAGAFAERAIHAGDLHEGLRLRARIFRAQGDVARALSDFERLEREQGDPAVRLILAKLYEHHQRDFAAALRLLERGTGEDAASETRRRHRLMEKAARRSRARS